MTSDVLTIDTDRDAERRRALARAAGMDALAEPQRELLIYAAKRYDWDILMGHVLIIEGRLYVTVKGLLHVAHRSGMLDGIETDEPVLVQPESRKAYLACWATVYRKDMSHPFRFRGRYPVDGKMNRYDEEMARKVAIATALRHAFDVDVPTVEERWDSDAEGDAPAAHPTAHDSIKAARAKLERATVEPAAEVAVAPEIVEVAAGGRFCGAVFDGEVDDPCQLSTGHDGHHQGKGGATWPA